MNNPKENKLLVRIEFPNQKLSTLVRFQIIFFTTRQIVKQNFHNMSDFKSKFLQRVRFCSEIFFKKSDFAQKYAIKKSRFD